MNFILSSSSKRRKDMLDLFGLEYKIVTTDVEQNLTLTSTPHINAMTSAFMKASEVYNRCEEKEDLLVLGADTIVAIGNYEFGKPKNFEDQINMLKFLSGKTHQAITGYAIMTKELKYVDYVSTDVTFKNLTDDMIVNYINSGEGIDKAGSYSAQGISSVFIEKMQGDYHNVVGLPMSKLYDVLKNRFNIDLLTYKK